MKLLITVVLGTLLSSVLGVDESKSHFYRTFNKLHQEPPPPEPSDTGRLLDVNTEWITQKLDHFDETNDKTWQMVINCYVITYCRINLNCYCNHRDTSQVRSIL